MAANKSMNKSQIDAFIDDQYQSFDTQKKAIILAIALIIPAVLFYFFIFSPKSDEQKSLTSQIETTKQEIARALVRIKDEPKFQKELAEVQAKFDEVVLKLPKKQEIPYLLTSISDLGRAVGLEFMSFAPGSEVQQDFYSEIPINMVLRGPYHSVGAFLDRVSKLERIVTVNNINMGGAKPEAGEILLTSNCQLVTYRYTGIPKNPEQQKKGRK